MERAREGERPRQGFPPGPLTGVCCEGSPERLVEPCLELSLFHDSANLPRLAFRLHLRLSPPPSSRSEPPRSISAASRHFFPMPSWPPRAGQHPGGGAEGSGSLLPPQVSLLLPRRSSRLAPPVPPPGSCQSPALRYRRGHQAALAPTIGSTQWGWRCCERHLHRSQLPLAPPNFSPPRRQQPPQVARPHHTWGYGCSAGELPPVT